jgi:acyl-CoA synthetase (NDP forming)
MTIKANATGTLDRILNPRRVAVVGVTSSGFGFGSGILASLISIGFEGELFPVNPKGGSIHGLDIHTSLESIPGEIDFAIIALPAHLVPDALEACRLKGAAGAEILSAGFRESGTAEGAALEERVREIAARGIRVIGPNCFGVYCPRSGLTLLPGPALSRNPGHFAFLSQSGGHTIDIAHMGTWHGIGFSAAISFGNGADLRETELLEYFGTDPGTRIIGMYIEGVQDGRRFFNALGKTCWSKPVIVYKGGLSEAGGKAVASHTASMGGSRVIWDSLLRQCNAVSVDSIPAMADTALAFSHLPWRRYRGISIVGGGGALGVAAADAADAYGMELPALAEGIREAIMALLPKPGSSAANPIDVANPYVSAEVIKDVLLLASRDERVDIQVLVQLLYHYKAALGMFGNPPLEEIVPVDALADAAREAVEVGGKPVVAVLPNHLRGTDSMDVEKVMRAARGAFLARGIPVFDDLGSAVRSIGDVSRYAAVRDRRERAVNP